MGQQHVADLVVCNRQVALIGDVVGLLSRKSDQQTMRFDSAGVLPAGIADDLVIARELDQHPSPAVMQFRRRASAARHTVQQALGIAQKRQRGGARHVVLLGLRHRHVDNRGGTLERGVEQCLVGLELLPRVDGAAPGRDRDQEEDARERAPESVVPPARSLGAAEDFFGVDAGEAGNHLGEAEALAIAAIA